MKPWYNTERVRQPGSVILNAWRAEHGPEAVRHRPPVQTSAQQRQYAGAQISRLTGDWNAINTSGDAELATSLRILRARSRQLCRDNEHAKNALRIVANNVIGSGVAMQGTVSTANGTLKDKVNTAIETAFEHWKSADRCHTAGKLHFHDIERVAMMAVVRDGEALIRKVRQVFGSDNNTALALELIEADRLVDTYSLAANPTNGNAIRMGVEVDTWLRPVAYWLYPTHPGDYQFAAFQPSQYIRVPADEMIHLHMIDRWPQTRGEPWFHAALKRMNNIGGYEEAEIVAARASASIMGFRQTPEADDPTAGIGDADGLEDGERVTDMSPGVILDLAPGETFTGFNPTRPNAAMDPFLRHMLRAAAAGIGCSYSAMTKDYSQANYSSERAAQLEDRALWRIIQGWFVRAFRAQIHAAWMDAAILGGDLSIPDYYTKRIQYVASVRFKPRGWSWIDPTKEVEAYKQAVRCGFMTVSDVIGLTTDGQDPEEIFKARAAELKLMEGLGLVFDTDPGQVNDKGQVQPTAPPDTASDEKPATEKPETASEGELDDG